MLEIIINFEFVTRHTNNNKGAEIELVHECNTMCIC